MIWNMWLAYVKYDMGIPKGSLPAGMRKLTRQDAGCAAK